MSPPAGLPEALLVDVLRRGWGVTAASIAYRAVGFGSHHWEVVDAAGGRWFANVDELATKRLTRSQSLDDAFARLRGSLAAAVALHRGGRTFVVAPVPALDGSAVVRVGDEFAAALYPFVEGRSFSWGDFETIEHRRGLLARLIEVHTAPASGLAPVEDFAVPHRDTLDAALGNGLPENGPFSRPVAELLAAARRPVADLLARYDSLVPARTEGFVLTRGFVLTHGEPHPGNTMLGSGGWLLIDWDTALVAPPERDLWTLDPGDGSILAAYTEATGVTARPALLDLYRLRWDVADLAVDVDRFCRPHLGTPDDEKAFEILRSLVGRLA